MKWLHRAGRYSLYLPSIAEPQFEAQVHQYEHETWNEDLFRYTTRRGWVANIIQRQQGCRVDLGDFATARDARAAVEKWLAAQEIKHE